MAKQTLPMLTVVAIATALRMLTFGIAF